MQEASAVCMVWWILQKLVYSLRIVIVLKEDCCWAWAGLHAGGGLSFAFLDRPEV